LLPIVRSNKAAQSGGVTGHRDDAALAWVGADSLTIDGAFRTIASFPELVSERDIDRLARCFVFSSTISMPLFHACERWTAMFKKQQSS
jgi:hypothetical protein